MKRIGAALLAILSACSPPKDPLDDVKPHIKIILVMSVEEVGRESETAHTDRIYIDTYLKGSVTNTSAVTISGVIVAVRSPRDQQIKEINLGDMTPGQMVEVFEFFFEGAYTGDKAVPVDAWLKAGALPQT